ncbi:hypothetical protein DNTS_027631 [Danionella cerebrum]|uniref:RNA polymerase II elongation factor ELL N-terminal domain-containing protein n=1 Tax=Danionella cerebrum TaxID=2873325 RepID=A0A553RAI7_9TELE|nr:hypothetical protein DNTS_027631 [Danionella translucida]
MAALRQEHRYGLSCGKINKSIPNKTIFHVKLTDTAIRTLEAYQKLKGSLPNQPAICFKGNQGNTSPPSPASHNLVAFYNTPMIQNLEPFCTQTMDCVSFLRSEALERLLNTPKLLTSADMKDL